MPLYDTSTARIPKPEQPFLKCPTVRSEHGYSVNIYDRSTDSPPKSLRCQFGRKYAQKKVRNIYLEDGRVEIDNSLVENAIRLTALGKKNWLFVGEATVGDRGAILYTVIESCRRRGLDPYAYLRDVLTRLPQMTNWQIPVVTPEAWSKRIAAVL